MNAHQISRTPGTAHRVGKLLSQWGTTLLPFAVLVAVWQLVVQAGYVPSSTLPAPMRVVETGVELIGDGQLLTHLWASLGRVVVGFAVSASLGIGLGLVLGFHRALAEYIEPLASFMNALSGIAWIPLAIVWFGLGQVTVTFILWNSIFFLVFFNTLVGVKNVSKIYQQGVLTLGAGPWQVMTQVLLPGALPNIANGIRMGMGFGWRALIAAEMVASTTGLGFMIFDASRYHRSDIILLGIVTMGVLWLATDRLLLVPFERWTIERWRLVSKLQ
ncbi:MAG TPA: ABC transporter permease [Ramlibacter sp.]|nr:ABC transporter permease [Ramlibacter sp.]